MKNFNEIYEQFISKTEFKPENRYSCRRNAEEPAAVLGFVTLKENESTWNLNIRFKHDADDLATAHKTGSLFAMFPKPNTGNTVVEFTPAGEYIVYGKEGKTSERLIAMLEALVNSGFESTLTGWNAPKCAKKKKDKPAEKKPAGKTPAGKAPAKNSPATDTEEKKSPVSPEEPKTKTKTETKKEEPKTETESPATAVYTFRWTDLRGNPLAVDKFNAPNDSAAVKIADRTFRNQCKYERGILERDGEVLRQFGETRPDGRRGGTDAETGAGTEKPPVTPDNSKPETKTETRTEKTKTETRTEKPAPKAKKSPLTAETKKWAEVLKTLSAVNMGLGFFGPAGTGKTYQAQKIAEALGVPCYLQGKVSHPSELKGFIDAQGCYHSTPLYKAFGGEGKPGILVIDEFDSWDIDTITAVNAALAQREFEFANGQLSAAPETMFIATQNTHFGGYENGYFRNEMDLSTVNRFSYFEIQYPEELEKSEFGSTLAGFVKECRGLLIASNVKGIITLRNLYAYKALLPIMGKEIAVRNGLLSTIADADTVERFYELAMKKNF